MAYYFQIFPPLVFLIGFSFSPTAEISRLELEVEESLPRKTASIFKEGIGQELNGAANQEKQIFLLCQISPSASSTRDLGTRLRIETKLCKSRYNFPTVAKVFENKSGQVVEKTFRPHFVFVWFLESNEI